jgi:acetoacetate decarboxylase
MSLHKSVIENSYSIPRTAPLYGSPPHEYRDSWIMNILFKTTSEVIRESVPEPLVPNSENLMSIFVCRHKASGLEVYNEVVLSVPSIFKEMSGNYAAYLYVDNDAAIAAGREIYGWPKKEARITIAEKDAVLLATVERGGIQLVSAAMELAELGKPEDFQFSEPWFNFKLIPSVKKDAPPEVMQLTSNTEENLKIKQVYTGRATLEFGTSPVDPLHKILIKEVLGGVYMNADFALTYGDIIYDYLTVQQ